MHCDRRLRILFVLIPALHPNDGGVQMSTCKLGRYFASIGHDVSVFSFSSTGHLDSEPLQIFHAQSSEGSVNLTSLGQLERILVENQFDVVINQMPYEHEIGQLLKSMKSYLLLGCLRNTLFSVRGNLQNYTSRVAPGPLKWFAASRALQQLFLAVHRRRHRADLVQILDTYDYFVMFGPPNLDELSYFVPKFDHEKVALIPNSVPEIEDFVPVKEKRLLWLGRVEHEQKQAEFILPIWKKVSEVLPDWQLDVVGEGPLLEGLRREAAESSLPRIEFHGRQEPDFFYKRASIFFMTSAFEGFPNALIEAQAHGCVPVVFESYPIVEWILRRGSGGFLVPPSDIDAMVQSIIEVAEDSDRWRKLSIDSLSNARRFSIDEVGKLWTDLFNRHRHGVPAHSDQGRS